MAVTVPTTVWSAQTDTLLRATRSTVDPARLDVVLPVGVWRADGSAVGIELHVEVDGVPQTLRAGRWDGQDLARVPQSRLDEVVAACRPGQHVDRPAGLDPTLRWYLDTARRQDPHNSYYEVVVEGVPVGARVEYRCDALADGEVVARTCTLALYAADPEFGRADLVAAHTPGGAGRRGDDDDTWWVLLHRSDAALRHFRVDVLSPADGAAVLPDLVVDVEGRRLDVRAPRTVGTTVWVPFLDTCTDSVVFSYPRSAGDAPTTPPVAVTRGGSRTVVDGSAPPRAGRLMILNFAIQGLNDLFEVPEDGALGGGPPRYVPPKTYAQITVEDPFGRYSSRPFRTENADPDGYDYAWRAQRESCVKTQWIFNAGLLLLLAHDRPDVVAALRKDVADGLVQPSNAGFGAHRHPYYDMATNLRELTSGAAVVETILGRCDGLHQPDQRIFEARPQEVEAYRAFGRQVRPDDPCYLLLDRSTVSRDLTVPADRRQYFADGTSGAGWTDDSTFASGNRLWRELWTGYRLLLIEDDLREGFINQSHEELYRGKVALHLRRMFMKALGDTSAQRPLFVFSDDADKPCGSGWFDATVEWVDGVEVPIVFTNRYQASLGWLAEHPWVEVVTTDDLDRDPGEIRDVRVDSATCPSVDPGGAATTDHWGRHLHFDTWHEWWRAFPSPWLGGPDGTLGDTLVHVEGRLLTADPRGVDPGLLDVAWASFLLSTHEQFWSTQPLEDRWAVNTSDTVFPPEDFVITESLQMRNALVYLNAARWAYLARDRHDATTHVDEGWLLDDLPDRHWDGDLLPNVLIYNDEVLLVLDANGGCVTHIFTRDGDRAFCVSGTPKCYQWFGPENLPHPGPKEPWYSCDGTMLQNTVWSPNHAYVAGDSALARPLLGRKYDARAKEDQRLVGWLYPNTFDEYDGAINGCDGYAFRYQEGTEPKPARDTLTDAGFQEICRRDHDARVHGTGTRVIWHDPTHVGFRKTVRLSGRRVTISYEGVQPGHVVANEFCAHVEAGLRGVFHTKTPAAGARAVELTGPDGVRVRVVLDDDTIVFHPAALLTAPVPDPAEETHRLRLHRVMTDNLEILCPSGGDFSYHLEL